MALCALAAFAADDPTITLGDAKNGHSVPESLWGISLEGTDGAEVAGLRRELVEMLAALKPAFLRYQPGCAEYGEDEISRLCAAIGTKPLTPQTDEGMVDEKYFYPPKWFLDAAHRYDGHERTEKPKICISGFACHDEDDDFANNLNSALCEAAAMTGLERNSDVVAMASYTPLLARYGRTKDQPALIWFDDTHCVATPSYYTQQLFSLNRPTRTIPATDNLAKNEKMFFYCAGLDETSGETILKFVNLSDDERDATVNISGKARLITLTGGCISDTNCPEKEAVRPVESTIEDFDGSITLPPYSLTILRLAK